jgi:hypothetical protein
MGYKMSKTTEKIFKIIGAVLYGTMAAMFIFEFARLAIEFFG